MTEAIACAFVFASMEVNGNDDALLVFLDFSGHIRLNEV